MTTTDISRSLQATLYPRRTLLGARSWRWTLTSANNRIIGASTEGYQNRDDARANLALLLGVAIDGPGRVERKRTHPSVEITDVIDVVYLEA